MINAQKKLGHALIACLLCACAGSGDDAGSSNNSGVFIAFGNDFQDFHSWQSFDVTADAPDIDAGIGPGTVHPDAMLIEYLNHAPPHGSTAFPVGTIIVKEGTEGDVIGRQYFAMVKRGGDENTNGAVGWEWFELRNQPDGSVGIVWRGVGPPAGEVYGGDPNAGCNTCHVACGNDSVCAKAVQLDQF
ncbi:MAG TPA: hypothetical protein VGM44_20015 [Polyangiaceae bacterium]|jgi:hypothetical protein